ncbi:hypothetical protein [Microbacterium sp. NIBRBAC000506063]|uniref:hypothetical protein n=1 Tax=Microbacterium sp. NIBRBAC000506063 TaxID=2734618 RepID=UPI001BB6F8F2|nr:hypothetical protein [Microbacterium sp. NIBRBAC000506063]QTV78942.1 hypothetical protein KAE78_06990 [Microbacterium sp. NIBRBAC000506063]
MEGTVTEAATTIARLQSPATVSSTGGVSVDASTAVTGGVGGSATARVFKLSGGAYAGDLLIAEAQYLAPVTAELIGSVVAGGAVGASAHAHRRAETDLVAGGGARSR